MGIYLRPTSLADAVQALADRPITILAGGTDFYPSRVVTAPDEDILDISAVAGLRAMGRDGDVWRIPALATWTDLIRANLPPLFDGLKVAARQVGGHQIQNAGTLVGNVCNASPAADGIPNLLALDAEIVLLSRRGERRLPLADFVLGPRHTARAADELVTGIELPHRDVETGFLKLGTRRYLVISIVMVAIALDRDSRGQTTLARVAVGACGPVARRLPALEAALIGHAPSPDLVTADHLAPLSPIDDVRGSAAYRTAATLELLRRGLADVATLDRRAA